jgi:hypothetical protein
MTTKAQIGKGQTPALQLQQQSVLVRGRIGATGSRRGKKFREAVAIKPSSEQ